MFKNLYKAIGTYYDTIFQSGYMSMKKVNELLVLDFLTELQSDPDYLLYATPAEQGLANKIYNCIVENNCLI
jgi:hypothetical protein